MATRKVLTPNMKKIWTMHTEVCSAFWRYALGYRFRCGHSRWVSCVPDMASHRLHRRCLWLVRLHGWTSFVHIPRCIVGG